MGTETDSGTPLSMLSALMRAAQAIVDRRNSMAASANTSRPGEGGDVLPASSDVGTPANTALRAPDPGARPLQAPQALPGQLLGSIGTLTGPSADGSGYEVRHADSGRLIAQGRSAQEADAQAQGLAGWLGRRRLVDWLKGNTGRSPPSPVSGNEQSEAPQPTPPATDASEDYLFLRQQKGGSDEEARFAVSPYDEAAADVSPNVINLGSDAVHDYLHLRHDLGWSDADASKAVGADQSHAFPYHSRNVEPYKADFVNFIYPAAWKNQQDTGIPAAITAAQAILESRFGASIPVDADSKVSSHNLFGIKAGPNDDYVSAATHEVLNGKRRGVSANFAAYDGYQGSIDAHSAFLQNNPRYSKLFDSTDPVVWAHGLQAAGYSTDPDYAINLIGVMKSWHLIPAK